MRNNKTIILWIFLAISATLNMCNAQGDSTQTGQDSAYSMPYQVKVGNSKPKAFKGTKTNELTREASIYPFFDSLVALKRPVRIMHIGDSHVRGHSFTVETRKALESVWGSQAVKPQNIDYRTTAMAKETGKPGLVYHALGKNGATCADFTAASYINKIKAVKPDLIILSFGTNECHVKHYDAEQHRKDLERMLQLLKDSCPNAVVMVTTPGGAYFSYKSSYTRKVKNKRGKRVTKKFYNITYKKNPNTVTCVNTITNFAKEHNLAVWDLYGICGGESNSAKNWSENKLMKKDHVHYTHEGYHAQGDMLAEAIMKAYNNYQKKQGNARNN